MKRIIHKLILYIAILVSLLLYSSSASIWQIEDSCSSRENSICVTHSIGSTHYYNCKYVSTDSNCD